MSLMTPKSFMYHSLTYLLSGKHRVPKPSTSLSNWERANVQFDTISRRKEHQTSSSLRWGLQKNLVSHRVGAPRGHRMKDRSWHSEAIGSCGTASSWSTFAKAAKQKGGIRSTSLSVQCRIRTLRWSFFRFVSYMMDPIQIQMADRLFEDMN